MTRRLLLSYLTLAALVLICLEIPLGYVYTRAERERATNAATEEAEFVADYAALSLTYGRYEELAQRVSACADRIGGRVLVVDSNGDLLATSHSLGPDQQAGLARRPEISAALRGGDGANVRTSTIGGVQWLSVAVPVRHGARLHGAVRLTVPTDAIAKDVHRVWLVLGLGGLAVLTAVAMAAFALARWIGRPIRELERAAQTLGGGSLSTPASVTTGPPEVRSLAVTFNRTAALLEHLLASQSAFAGEASHQLKTPLAALRLRLDNMEPTILPHMRGNLDAAMAETDRLARMVEGLLALARMEETALTPEPVDLDEVLGERALVWSGLYARQGVLLLLTGRPVGAVLAVPGAVEQILDNLLSNALRVAPKGSLVTLSRRLSATGAELYVEDQGPGMTAEQRGRAFDRFWRAPDAAKGGTGLGLALVQRLTLASGGEALLLPAPGGGLKAVIRLQPAMSRRSPRGLPGLPRPRHRPVAGACTGAKEH
ncbi:HAMP domain-containing histidine kinase [Streptomyces sp. NBC_01142]|uniref:sensor histidine kinase n=1 Tax=Streptomyces sp. NBC_01142 TaxID=2975865 RepID=UPI002252F7C3|nr:HAMP domain-containing sensor histidine kinase [Streptomyces sp. NBC_01142]MCX4821277.1 HAMP domain-containing histidine kinase [Streptomyces sp. NBC_01142]